MFLKYIIAVLALVLIVNSIVDCKPITDCKYDLGTIESLYNSYLKFRNYLQKSGHEKLTLYSHEYSELLKPSEYVLAYSVERAYLTESYITGKDKNVTVGGEYTSGGVPPVFYNKNDSLLAFTEYQYDVGSPKERVRFSVPLAEFDLGASSKFLDVLSSDDQQFLKGFYAYRKQAYDFYNSLETQLKEVFFKDVGHSYR